MPVTYYHSVGGELLGETASGSRVDYVADALGSVPVRVGDSDGTEAARSWRPYGSQMAGSSSTYGFVGTLGYRGTGRRFASHHALARHYDGATGSWTSVDPLWPVEPAYHYVEGNPTSWADPSGLGVAIISVPAALGLSYKHAYIQFEHPCVVNGIPSKSFGFGSFDSREGEAAKRIKDPTRGGVACSPPRKPTPITYGPDTFPPSDGSPEGLPIMHGGGKSGSSGAILFPDPDSRTPRKSRYDPRHFGPLAEGKRQIDLVSYSDDFERFVCSCVQESIKKGVPEYRFCDFEDTEPGFYTCGSWARDMFKCASKKMDKHRPGVSKAGKYRGWPKLYS